MSACGGCQGKAENGSYYKYFGINWNLKAMFQIRVHFSTAIDKIDNIIIYYDRFYQSMAI